MSEGVVQGQSVAVDTWAWWQARRLRYNFALGGAGLAAYALTVGLYYSFGERVWASVEEAAGMTLFLGTMFLVVMGIANILYMLGPFTESVVKPKDVRRFRETAWAMGLWGSVSLPFLFTLVNFSMLINEAGLRVW
jgi:hypothetical protein